MALAYVLFGSASPWTVEGRRRLYPYADGTPAAAIPPSRVERTSVYHLHPGDAVLDPQSGRVATVQEWGRVGESVFVRLSSWDQAMRQPYGYPWVRLRQQGQERPARGSSVAGLGALESSGEHHAQALRRVIGRLGRILDTLEYGVHPASRQVVMRQAAEARGEALIHWDALALGSGDYNLLSSPYHTVVRRYHLVFGLPPQRHPVFGDGPGDRAGSPWPTSTSRRRR